VAKRGPSLRATSKIEPGLEPPVFSGPSSCLLSQHGPGRIVRDTFLKNVYSAFWANPALATLPHHTGPTELGRAKRHGESQGRVCLRTCQGASRARDILSLECRVAQCGPATRFANIYDEHPSPLPFVRTYGLLSWNREGPTFWMHVRCSVMFFFGTRS
jgi:hypothetical protein